MPKGGSYPEVPNRKCDYPGIFHRKHDLSHPGDLQRRQGLRHSIEAENVTIAGYFEGEMACSGLLTIAKTGTVKGRVAYGTLSVELGGLLDAEFFQLESTDTKLISFHRKGVLSDE